MKKKFPFSVLFPCTKILSQICKNKVESQMHRSNWYSMVGLMLFNVFRLTFRLISVKGFFVVLGYAFWLKHISEHI